MGEVTNSIYLPSKTNIKLLVSSNDVIHSFSLPSLGIKVDALPGRVNQVLINISNAFSMLKGNCTEICGIYHNSMSTSITIINNYSNIWLLGMMHHLLKVMYHLITYHLLKVIC